MTAAFSSFLVASGAMVMAPIVQHARGSDPPLAPYRGHCGGLIQTTPNDRRHYRRSHHDRDTRRLRQRPPGRPQRPGAVRVPSRRARPRRGRDTMGRQWSPGCCRRLPDDAGRQPSRVRGDVPRRAGRPPDGGDSGSRRFPVALARAVVVDDPDWFAAGHSPAAVLLRADRSDVRGRGRVSQPKRACARGGDRRDA